MAILEEDIAFTGSLGRLSAYKMKGSDKIIIRKKGGPKKKQVLKSPAFELTRGNMNEFCGVGLTVRAIRSHLLCVRRLSDHNFTPTLTTICKKIQLLDPIGDRGKRSIYLSQHRYMLAGFRLHRKHPFLSIVTGPVGCTFNRDTKSAVIQLPGLIQGINLLLPWKQPLYRFRLSLGLVPDIVCEGKDYNEYRDEWADTYLETRWQVASEPFQSQTVELKLDKPEAIKDSQTLLFSIGIEMGTPTPYGEIEAIEYAGSACILAVG